MTDQETVPGMAEGIKARMAEQRLDPVPFAKAAGLTLQGLAPVRAGEKRNYSGKTLRGVAEALAWPDDWYERLLAGEDPKKLPNVLRLTSPADAAAEAGTATLAYAPEDHGRILADHEARLRRLEEALGGGGNVTELRPRQPDTSPAKRAADTGKPDRKPIRKTRPSPQTEPSDFPDT